MESLFEHCDNFLNMITNDQWLSPASDLKSVIDKAMRHAHFIESLYIRLSQENCLEDFFKDYQAWRKEVNALRHSLFKNACDELLSSIYKQHKSETNIIHVAVTEYNRICGLDRFKICLKFLVAESIAVKALTAYVTDPSNFSNPADQEKVSIEVWNHLLIKSLEHCNQNDDQGLRDAIDELIQSQKGIESMLLITLNTDQNLENIQMLILNAILQRTVNVESENIQNFWKIFINCDRKILIDVFSKHSWFFEEFFEFIVRTAHELECSYEGEGCEWRGVGWLTFSQLVSLVQWLWSLEGYTGGYVRHTVTQTREQRIWQDVRQNFTNVDEL